MRRRQHLISFGLVILSLLWSQTRSEAQSDASVRTVNPLTTSVELSEIEPLPPGILPQMAFGVHGGGGGGVWDIGGLNNQVKSVSGAGIYWAEYPQALVRPSFWNTAPGFVEAFSAQFNACGYPDNVMPTATLLYPSKRTEKVVLQADSNNNKRGTCWSYKFEWQRGIELGLYTLTLDHAQGKLAYTWGMDYPKCHAVFGTMLLGFAPEEPLTLQFYVQDFPNEGGSTTSTQDTSFIATRDVKTDKDGNLFIDVKVSRSASFYGKPIAFGIIGPENRRYYPLPEINGTVSTSNPGGATQPIASAKYPTYSGYVDANCNALGRFAQVNPTQGSQLPLYASFNDRTSMVAQIESGSPVENIEEKPAVENGKVIVWHHLRTENGVDGWNTEDNLLPVITNLIPGGTVEIQKQVVDPSNGGNVNPTLFQTPNGGGTGYVLAGDTALLIKSTKVEYNTWWLVQTRDSRQGWLRETSGSVENMSIQPALVALPWALKPLPVESVATQIPPTAPPALNIDGDYIAYANTADLSRIAPTTHSAGWRPQNIPANPSAPPRSQPAYWTTPGNGSDWIRWKFRPSLSGSYTVVVYIPSLRGSPLYNTRSARYQISHDGGTDTVSVNQNDNIGNNITLGKFHFSANNEYNVYLDDNTGEQGTYAITADTITWSFDGS